MAGQQKNGMGHGGKRKVVLVLQGGGALGAYHIGAYQALHEAGFEPDWIAGISIGAINAAVIAGNKADERLAALDSLWDAISRPDETGRALYGSWLRWYNQYNVAEAMTLGQPNFWFPRIPSPLVLPSTPTDQASFYDTTPMLETLRTHVNFGDLGKAGYGRLSVGATRVDTGELEFFDSDEKTVSLGPEHVLASGSLPPGFAATRVGEYFYWDGGCVSNTPLNAILDDQGDDDLLVFMIDLWNADGALPTTMDEVAWRQKQIQYASRSSQVETLCQVHNLRHSLAQHELAASPSDKSTEAVEGKVAAVPQRQIDIVHIIYQPSAEESSFSDAEFSRSSIARRREAGAHDMKIALDHASWNRLQLRAGQLSTPVVIHRLQQGRLTSLTPR
ncbi:patatin-like phospholipase family protein [Neisseriaceae bacterium JH1-16]|nr:patatin-like phospholipase family protein [Neisseriaceae bacterium JH1-16]